MKRQFLAIVVALIVFAFLSTLANAASVPTTAPTTQDPVKATTDALNTKIESFKSDGEPLEGVIQHIAKMYKLTIKMQWDALKKAGIDQKTPVNLTLSAGLHVRELLKQIMRPGALSLTITDPDLLPQRSIRDSGEIVFTTRTDMFAHFASTRSYPLPNSGPAGIDAVKAAVAPESWAAKPDGVGGKIAVDADLMVVTQTDDNQRWMASVVAPAASP